MGGEVHKVVYLFAYAYKLYGNPKLTVNGYDYAAFGCAVKLCEDYACDVGSLGEELCLIYGVLSCGGIEDEEGFERAALCLLAADTGYLFQLVHKVFLVVKSACGVADNYVRTSCLCGAYGIKYHRGGVGAFGVLHYLCTRSVHPYLKLVYGGCTECIRCGDYYLFALGGEPCGKLSDGCGLACAVDADDENYRGLGGVVYLPVLSKHFGDYPFKLIFNFGGVFYALFLNGFSQLRADIHRGLYADVAHYKGLFKLFKKILVYFGKGIKEGIYLSHHRIPCFSDAFGNFFKKSHSVSSLGFSRSGLPQGAAPFSEVGICPFPASLRRTLRPLPPLCPYGG